MSIQYELSGPFLLLTSILQNRAIPASRNGVSSKPLFSKLSSVLEENNGSACFEERKGHDGPKGPWQLEYLADLKLLALLTQLLASCRIVDAMELAVGHLGEPIENDSHDVGEDIHEDGDPEYPSEVPGLLGDDIRG